VLPRIDSIRQIRLKLGITQKRLADIAGVSASMINQIESGRSTPGYDTAKKIFDGLASLEYGQSSHKAGDFCSTDIVKMNAEDTMHDAIKKMREYSISQIPVFDEKVPVGMITEDGIMKHLADAPEPELKTSRLADSMDPAPPIIDYSTPAAVLVPLIRFTKCILVTKDAKIIGIITASDALKLME